MIIFLDQQVRFDAELRNRIVSIEGKLDELANLLNDRMTDGSGDLNLR